MRNEIRRNPQEGDDDAGVSTIDQPDIRTEKPRLYKVLLHNDDFTSMEFVVAVLMEVFHHAENDAMTIMLHVHHNGIGVAGVYTYEVAETRVSRVMAMAKEAQFPLLCTMEPE
ncbi:MAG: ATP-dependent Clp protease adaptor ClpS [Candidatus Hydrogenedentota bacterium]